MKSIIVASCLSLLIPMSAFAASEKLCESVGNVKIEDTSAYSGAVIINNQVAKELYEALRQPALYRPDHEELGGVAVSRKIGTSYTCFKQVFFDCVTYSCSMSLL